MFKCVVVFCKFCRCILTIARDHFYAIDAIEEGGKEREREREKEREGERERKKESQSGSAMTLEASPQLFSGAVPAFHLHTACGTFARELSPLGLYRPFALNNKRQDEVKRLESEVKKENR